MFFRRRPKCSHFSRNSVRFCRRLSAAYTVLTALAGYLGVVVKQLCTKYINDKTKQSVAKTVVRAVEQIYTGLHGEEKLNKALIAASEMFAEEGITITELEMRMLIEAALAEFGKAFEKQKKVILLLHFYCVTVRI